LGRNQIVLTTYAHFAEHIASLNHFWSASIRFHSQQEIGQSFESFKMTKF